MVSEISRPKQINKKRKNGLHNRIQAFEIESAFQDDSNSKQIHDPFESMITTGDVIKPPIDMLFWAKQLELSSALHAVVETKAVNTVGMGWNISPIDEPLDTESSPEKIKEQTKILKKIFNKPNKKMSLTEVLKRAVIDEESTGNGYLEIGRDSSDEIIYIGHIPSHTIRIRSRKNNNSGFVQLRGNKKRYFKDFGDTRSMHMITGSRVGRISQMNSANELLHFCIYNPRDSFYGVPRHIAAAPAITGNRLAQLYNVHFFKNNATPRLIITVSGGNLDPDSMQTTKDFLSSAKGPTNAGRALILQGHRKTQRSVADSSKIEVHPITVGQTDDGSYLEYQKRNDSEIRETHRISGVLTGQIDNIPRTNAVLARQITNEQVFKPAKKEKEYIINQSLVDAILGDDAVVEFSLDDIPAIDPITKSRVDRVYAGVGALSVDDLRDIKGLKRFNNEWSNLPPNFAFEKFKSLIAGIEPSNGSSGAGEETQNNPRTRRDEPTEQ